MNAFHIGHIGIIVPDLDAAMGTLSRLFDIEPASVKELHAVGLRIAEFHAENITLELIEHVTEQTGLARSTMGASPGLNHISVTVHDMNHALEHLQNKGLSLMEGFPRPGSHGTVAFFHPEPTTGLLLEICSPHEGNHS
jgi:methylmalonyl-CoA/ethylmalonyl-CoA epimerase